MAGTGRSAPDVAVAAPQDVPAGSVDSESALGIPWQSGLDPLTGLADRCWFLRALAAADGSTSGASDGVGVIAIRIDGLRDLLVSHGGVAADGVLLLTAEVLHGWSRGDDLAARLGVDRFGILMHTDAAGLDADRGAAADKACRRGRISDGRVSDARRAGRGVGGMANREP